MKTNTWFSTGAAPLCDVRKGWSFLPTLLYEAEKQNRCMQNPPECCWETPPPVWAKRFCPCRTLTSWIVPLTSQARQPWCTCCLCFDLLGGSWKESPLLTQKRSRTNPAARCLKASSACNYLSGSSESAAGEYWVEADQLQDLSKLGTRQGDGERVRGDGIQGELAGKIAAAARGGRGVATVGGWRGGGGKQIDPKQLSKQ